MSAGISTTFPMPSSLKIFTIYEVENILEFSNKVQVSLGKQEKAVEKLME